MIMCAPNGARRTRSDHPSLPVTARDLGEDAAALLDVCVSVLHLHVRDRGGAHTLAVDAYREAIAAIRAKTSSSLVIQVTSEAVGQYSPAQQMGMVRELRPEAVSLALNEFCPDRAGEAEAAKFISWLKREHIWPQYILYSPAELQRFEQLRRKGFFSEEHPACMLVLGNYSKQLDGSVDKLSHYLDATDCSEYPWTTCCFGRHEHKVMLAALNLGGHVRLGFENNLWLPDGKVAESNAQLVSIFLDSSVDQTRVPATADEVREALFQSPN
jgi:uncharacterized protein (DUF849 family)